MHRLDHTADVVAQHLSPDLIGHRRRGLAAHRIPELGFDHVEGRLHVRALVIVGQEFLTVQAVEVEHLSPHPALPTRRALLERNVWRGPSARYILKVGYAAVA